MCPPPTISSVPNATFGYEDKVFGREVFGRQEAHRSGQGWQGCKLPPRAASSSFLAFHAFANPPFCFSCFRHKWADGCKTGHLPAKLTSPLWLAQQMIETSIANQIRFLTDPGIWCPIFGSRCLPFF